MNIRKANSADAMQILNIYQYYVENTVISFEEKVPTLKEMGERITKITLDYPWLVCEDDGQLLGYAYATRFRSRPAYRWTAEVTIYLDDQAMGKGIAGTLYQSLFDVLTQQGFYIVVAVVTEPNPQSEKFHQKMGFKKFGTFNSVGYKRNQWNSTGWWQKELKPLSDNPNPPVAFSELQYQV